MTSNYKFVYIHEITKAKLMLEEKVATHIPILDINKKVLDIYYLNDNDNQEITNPIVFMAGGKEKD